MFDGFEELDVRVSEDVTIRARRGGDGPPVLMLHGIPETHVMWHRIASRLAERFTVVATDLRGFGGSSAPPSDPDHAPYSMRVLAQDQVACMSRLGFERFAVVGHDRGARCAYRMAIDHPEVVARVAVLDIVPTGHAFNNAHKDFALGYWVWSFLAAPHPVPEELIGRAPEVFVNYMLDHWADEPGVFSDELRQIYVEQFRDPVRRHAICEQYRAAASWDVTHDNEDAGGRAIRCPLLALWSEGGPVDTWYDPLQVWAGWADDVSGGPLPGGHFLPEESPAEVLHALEAFLSGATPS